MLRTDELWYDLPPALIATRAAEPRDSARVLVVHVPGGGGGGGSGGVRLEHRVVRDLPRILTAGDMLVVNDSRVLRARLSLVRSTGGRAEGLFVGVEGDGLWRVLVRGERLRPGVVLRAGELELELVARVEGAGGLWRALAREAGEPVALGATASLLERVGLTPLPPYIVARRKLERATAEAACGSDDASAQDDADRARYQTVYAEACDGGGAGSVAAPTAGLHLTPELLAELASVGVAMERVTLHVGTGTFRPVTTEHVEQHAMHEEWCSMSASAADRLARWPGRRIAVGTTSVRTMETYARAAGGGVGVPASIATRLLITPGHRFAWTDGLVTNFHLPGSTLMALVSALLPGGAAELVGIYREAIARGYRFYSFGDAMLVLPAARGG